MRPYTVPVFAACVVLVMVTGNSAQVAVVDLEKGTVTPSNLLPGITWFSRLTSPQRSCTCSRQGVLKLQFDTATRKRAKIVLWYAAARGYTFHIGDSRTNNGHAGDGATQSNDAEVHDKDGTLYIFGKDRSRGRSWGQLLKKPDFLNGVYRLEISVSNEKVVLFNGRETVTHDSPKLFALAGQSDFEGPVNYDVYLGLNRVVAGGSRFGTGLCRAEISWHADA